MSQAREIRKDPPAELWVVWAEGKYRIYWSAKHASNRFDAFVKAGVKAEILRYDFAEVQGCTRKKVEMSLGSTHNSPLGDEGKDNAGRSR